MSDRGAMIDYLLAKVAAVRPDSKRFGRQVNIKKRASNELPACAIFAPAWRTDLVEFRQKKTANSFILVWVEEFPSGDSEEEAALRDLLDTAQAIERAIWDANTEDTDAKGYFAYVASGDLRSSSESSTRHGFVMEVVIDTVDIEDGGFVLKEANV